jgi:ferredoxin
MTPEVTFQSNGYCLEDCNLCSRVCPSGAITLFDINAKSQLKMGIALIHPEKCLLTEFSECDRCKAACSYEAMDIVSYGMAGPMIPVVDTEKCIGCGACAAICPPQTIDTIPYS